MSSQKTKNLQLNKWNPQDGLIRSEWNENFDKIDTEIDSTKTQLADIVTNVKSFGAKLDNNTDDILSINSAIQYVKNLGGGTVKIPQGYAKISSPILLETGVLLQGSGRDGTFIVPTYSSGDVICGTVATKQKPRIEDLTIKPETYQNKLIGINYKYLQYASVKRVDVWNCGIGYEFDGTIGCYYNKQVETRAISCGYGVRTKDGGGIPKPNSNEINDLTIISPIIGVLYEAGNTNKFIGIKIESLANNPHPSLNYDGQTVTSSNRWVLKIMNGTVSYFEKFRSEFDGNLISLGSTYGHYLKDFSCNYNGIDGAYIQLLESPTNPWQTNNLSDVELGYSLPFTIFTYYNRHSRLSQKIQLPPQISMTPRDVAGPPTSGEKGLIRMDSLADLWVGTDLNVFKRIFYDETSTYTKRGGLKFHKNSTAVEERTIAPGTHTSVGVSMSGLLTTDSVTLSTTVRITNGLIVYPPQIISNGSVVIYIFNPTTAPIVLPAGNWTVSYVRP